jgi:mercuric ion transport protein
MTLDKTRLKESSVSVLTLFTSAGTLVCCALPILLVTLGMGAAVASLTSSAPWLVALSEHKIWVFGVSFVMLLLCAWFIYRPGRSCPADPDLARTCARIDTVNQWIYWSSVTVWLVGFFAAFLLWPLTEWLNG